MKIHMKRLLITCVMVAGAAQAEDLLPDISRAKPKDALYGQALYQLHSGDYEAALGSNQALRKRNGRRYGKMLDVQESIAELGLGMNERANDGFKRLLADERMALVPSPARAQAWFYLAKSFYSQGYWDNALVAMRKVDEQHLATELKDEYHFLIATLEMFRGKPALADKHVLALKEDSPWATYAFLNLAVSYTERDVHIDKVEAAFNKALELTKNTQQQKALSDRINLMAGQFFFDTGRGRSAIKHLRSVNLEGAYTPKALLTYGWALTEQWQYHEALQPWYMLKTAHSPLNQDVQETLIAIPHLLEKLNAKVLALGAFEYATEQYDAIHQQLGDSATRLNTGKFIEPLLASQVPDKWGSFVPLDLTLPNHPDRIYLKDVMAQGYFQGQLTKLRDLHVMRHKVLQSLYDLEAFEDTLATRKTEYQALKADNAISARDTRYRDMDKRYKTMLRSINKAFNNPDGTGLASEHEKEQLSSFKDVNARIKKLAGSKVMESKRDRTEYQDRLRRVEGVLKWQLSERYAERKRQVSSQLAVLEEALRTAKNRLASARAAYDAAPEAFAQYPQRIAQLRAKYQNQLTKLDKIYQRQRFAVGTIVKEDIKQRQARILDYQLQARLAAARLFDETSNKARSLAVETATKKKKTAIAQGAN